MADAGDLYQELEGLYGKLDRLLEKRAPDVLAERANPEDDFPVLTEVVPEDIPVRHRVPRPAASQPSVPPAHAAEHVAAPATESAPEIPEDLMAAVEARLFALLARHQREVDEAVRRIVREELARRSGR